jgi:hypothetical protein
MIRDIDYEMVLKATSSLNTTIINFNDYDELEVTQLEVKVSDGFILGEGKELVTIVWCEDRGDGPHNAQLLIYIPIQYREKADNLAYEVYDSIRGSNETYHEYGGEENWEILDDTNESLPREIPFSEAAKKLLNNDSKLMNRLRTEQRYILYVVGHDCWNCQQEFVSGNISINKFYLMLRQIDPDHCEVCKYRVEEETDSLPIMSPYDV